MNPDETEIQIKSVVVNNEFYIRQKNIIYNLIKLNETKALKLNEEVIIKKKNKIRTRKKRNEEDRIKKEQQEKRSYIKIT